MTPQLTEQGIALIKSNEGLRPTAYRDMVGVWTIGYGHTRTAKRGMRITTSEAERLLREDLDTFIAGVRLAIGDAPTSDNEFSAFVSLAYNIGLTAFRESTALLRHSIGDKRGAADAIQWFNRAGGYVVKGLIRRREAEARLYLTP